MQINDKNLNETFIAKPLGVVVNKNNIGKALILFKKKVKESGILVELYERSFYTKKSTKKRRQKNKAKLRNKYKLLEEKRGKN